MMKGTYLDSTQSSSLYNGLHVLQSSREAVVPANFMSCQCTRKGLRTCQDRIKPIITKHIQFQHLAIIGSMPSGGPGVELLSEFCQKSKFEWIEMSHQMNHLNNVERCQKNSIRFVRSSSACPEIVNIFTQRKPQSDFGQYSVGHSS